MTKTVTVPVEPAPPNALPDWNECALRVANSGHIAKRIEEGGYGADPDTLLATELHRFIYEYDDADPVKSGWFLHRLELLLKETVLQAAPQPEAMKAEHVKLLADAKLYYMVNEPGQYVLQLIRALQDRYDAPTQPEAVKALRGKYRDQLNPTDQAEWQPIETAPMDGTEVEAVSTGSLGVRLYPVASRFLEGKWCAWFGPQLEWGPYDPQPDAWRPKQTPPTPGRCVNGGISRMRARGLPAAVNTGCSQMAGLLKTDTNSATAAVSRSA